VPSSPDSPELDDLAALAASFGWPIGGASTAALLTQSGAPL
jgi:hypothetical protein